MKVKICLYLGASGSEMEGAAVILVRCEDVRSCAIYAIRAGNRRIYGSGSFEVDERKEKSLMMLCVVERLPTRMNSASLNEILATRAYISEVSESTRAC